MSEYMKNENEIYGRSPGVEAFNDYLQAMRSLRPWFTVSLRKSWWWRILHPFQYRRVKKWIFEVEGALRRDLENPEFEKKLKTALIDRILYEESQG